MLLMGYPLKNYFGVMFHNLLIKNWLFLVKLGVLMVLYKN